MMRKFCPVCHREVPIPDWLKTNNFEGNKISLGCGNCKQGKVIITSDELKEKK